MTLEEEVQKEAEKYTKMKELAAAFNQSPYDSNIRKDLGELVHSIEPAELETFAVGQAPDVVDNYIKNYTKLSASGLNEAVKGKYNQVLELFDDEKLLNLLFSIAPLEEDEDFKDVVELHQRFAVLRQALQNKDISAYIGMAKTKEAREAMEYAATASQERVLRNMVQYTKILQKELVEKLKEKKTKIDYLMRIYNKSKEEQQEQMNVRAGSLVK